MTSVYQAVRRKRQQVIESECFPVAAEPLAMARGTELESVGAFLINES